MPANIYTLSLRKNFNVVAQSRIDALAEARRIIVELMNDGWFYDSDFEIVQTVDIDSID